MICESRTLIVSRRALNASGFIVICKASSLFLKFCSSEIWFFSFSGILQQFINSVFKWLKVDCKCVIQLWNLLNIQKKLGIRPEISLICFMQLWAPNQIPRRHDWYLIYIELFNSRFAGAIIAPLYWSHWNSGGSEKSSRFEAWLSIYL